MRLSRQGVHVRCRVHPLAHTTPSKSHEISADSCRHQIVKEHESGHFLDIGLTLLQGVSVGSSGLFFVEAVASLMGMCQLAWSSSLTVGPSLSLCQRAVGSPWAKRYEGPCLTPSSCHFMSLPWCLCCVASRVYTYRPMED